MRKFDHLQGGEPVTAEQHTAALQQFLIDSTRITNQRAFWHSLTAPEVDADATSDYVVSLVDETLTEVVEHVQWLNEQGFVLAMQVDERSSYMVVGVGMEEETLNYIAHIADPQSQTVVEVPVLDVRQLSVYPVYPH